MNQVILLQQPRHEILVLDTKCWAMRHSGQRTPTRAGLAGLAQPKIAGL